MEPDGSRAKGLWAKGTPVVGMIHLPPLPGSPGYGGSMAPILERALREGELLTEAGLDGLLVENFGDIPFHPGRVPPETVAAMAVAVRELARRFHVPVGVNVLRNDASAALAVAAAGGARFIRVNVHTGVMFTDQGLLEGEAHRTLRLRAVLDPSILILADVMVKHASPPPGVTLEQAARDTWLRGKADALVLSGRETGGPVAEKEIRRLRVALPPNAQIWVGSGVTRESLGTFQRMADGIIIGSALHTDGIAGRGIDPKRVRLLTEALERTQG